MSRARVVVLAGPSGSGKSRLAERLRDRHGWPIVRLDDFYRDASDPDLPLQEDLGIVDWDDPASWDGAAAVSALVEVVDAGIARLPVYDIATSRATGEHAVSLTPGSLLLAEGIFAAEIIGDLDRAGVLHSAWCVHHPRLVGFLLRLARDLRERRKPPLVLVRRGLALLRAEPGIVARQVTLGARPVRARDVEALLPPGTTVK